MIWFTMLNVLKKVATMTISAKQAKHISERVLDRGGRDKDSDILKHQIEKNTLVHNTRILKLLAVASVITLQ